MYSGMHEKARERLLEILCHEMVNLDHLAHQIRTNEKNEVIRRYILHFFILKRKVTLKPSASQTQRESSLKISAH